MRSNLTAGLRAFGHSLVRAPFGHGAGATPKARLIRASIALGALVAGGVAQAQLDCSHRSCPPGSKVATTPGPDTRESYYVCQTSEIADYVNFNEAAIDMSAMSFTPPTISDKTGDVVLSGAAQQKQDQLRAKAGVKTYQDALASCVKKIAAETMTVVQLKPGAGSILARDAQGQQGWVPKGFIKPLGPSTAAAKRLK